MDHDLWWFCDYGVDGVRDGVGRMREEIGVCVVVGGGEWV